MDTLTNMKLEAGEFNVCLWRHANKDIRLFYRGDDFVILVDETDLQLIAKELNEALIVKVCGVLGSDESDPKRITLLSSILPNGWLFW